MMDKRPRLTVQRRTQQGTRPARRLRREGLIPGVVYGKTVEPTAVTVNRHEFVTLLHAREREHGLLTLCVTGEPSATKPRVRATASKALAAAAQADGWEKPVLIKHLDRDPVNGGIIHVDFQAIVLTKDIRVKITVVLKGEPAGVKEDDGILEHFLREIEVECLPTAIPDQFEHEVSEMRIGQAIHVRDLTPPAGVKILTDADAVIASILAPKEAKLEEPVEAAAAGEPEVIREKKAEEGGAEAGEAKPDAKKPEEKSEKKKAEEKPEKKEKKGDS